MRQAVILPDGTKVNHALGKEGCCRIRLFREPCMRGSSTRLSTSRSKARLRNGRMGDQRPKRESSQHWGRCLTLPFTLVRESPNRPSLRTLRAAHSYNSLSDLDRVSLHRVAWSILECACPTRVFLDRVARAQGIGQAAQKFCQSPSELFVFSELSERDVSVPSCWRGRRSFCGGGLFRD